MKWIKFGDIIILLIVITVIILLFSSSIANTEASSVRIDTPTQTFIYPLDKDNTYIVDGYLGKSIIEVKDKIVRFTDSPCPNRICIKNGPIHSAGGILVCLPNGVSVSITGERSEVDDVSI